MARVALVVHPHRDEATRLAEDAHEWLRSRGHEVSQPPGAAGEAPPPGTALDLAVSLGGDGTMLRAVELAGPLGAPVLGVDLGHLSYLTEVEAAGLTGALERFFAGDYGVEERTTLEVSVERRATAPGGEGTRLALNEAVVEKVQSGHTIRLAAAIAGRPFISYAADAVLVATPTGSTAYNLSARGPIVSPGLQALLVTPVSPHMLFDRSLVLEPREWLRMELLGPRPAALVVDGMPAGSLEPGDAVACRPSARPARLVTFGPRDFHAILKAKFGLADR